jgi:hypothetical protein
MAFVSAVFMFDLIVFAVVLVAIPCVLVALAFRKPSHS